MTHLPPEWWYNWTIIAINVDKHKLYAEHFIYPNIKQTQRASLVRLSENDWRGFSFFPGCFRKGVLVRL